MFEIARFIIDASVFVFHFCMIFVAIFVHRRFRKEFPQYERVSVVLCGTMILVCLVGMLKNTADMLFNFDNCSSKESVAYIWGWGMNDYLLIVTYALHLLIWGQIYEDMHVNYYASTAPLLSQKYENRKPNRKSLVLLVIYLILLLLLILTIEIIFTIKLLGDEFYCDMAFDYSVKWYYEIWSGIFFSTIFITFFFLIHLKLQVFNKYYNQKSITDPHTKAQLTFPAFLTLLCFFIRTVFLTVIANSEPTRIFLKKYPISWEIIWSILQVAPIILIFVMFLSLKSKKLYPLNNLSN